MARGSTSVRNQATNTATDLGSQATGLLSTAADTNTNASGGINTLMKNPGYTGAEKSQITGDTMSSLDSAYDSGQQGIQSQAARTRNNGGVDANLADLANKRAQGKAQAVARLGGQFAGARMTQQQQALQDILQQYGIQTNEMAGLNNSQVGALGVAAGTAKGGFGTPLFSQNWG